MTDSSNTNNTTAKHKFTFTVSEVTAEVWRDHRDELEMSTDSEYIRAMVEAGRKQLSLVSPLDSGGEGSLRNQILAVLDDEEFKDWDEIRAALIRQLEEDLDAELKALEEAGEVETSPRRGWRK